MRGAAAPSRQHDSRHAVNRLPEEPARQLKTSDDEAQSLLPSQAAYDSLLADTTQGTTGGEKMDESHLLSVTEVARLLQVPVSWVYEHTRPRCATPLPYVRLGKYLRFLPTDIKDFLEDARSVRSVSR
jgi:predicted DNA-binding transcriptional regulator AlpA